MTYRILFLDIDGTILKADHTYTDSTKEAIEQAKKKGIDVFLATGRPRHEIRELAKELNIHSCIASNGAYAEFNEQTIIEEPLDTEIIHSFLEAAKMHGFDMVLYANDKNYFTSFDTPAVQTFLDTFQLTTNALWHPDVKANILGVTLIGVDDDSLKHLSVPTGIHLSPVHVGDVQDAYDIIRQNVNKGQAVQKVLETMNISQTVAIAFGDGMNDKEMLQVVGEGFAMGNAHPDLFSYAKHRTNTVDDSGIYNGLKQLGVID